MLVYGILPALPVEVYIIAFVLCGFYVVLSVAGMILIKLGSSERARSLFEIPFVDVSLSWISFSGFVCFGTSFILFTFVLSKYPLGSTVPVLSGMANILIFIAGIVIFKESHNTVNIVGLILIVGGIILMNIKNEVIR